MPVISDTDGLRNASLLVITLGVVVACAAKLTPYSACSLNSALEPRNNRLAPAVVPQAVL
jgi:hypothetical protein